MNTADPTTRLNAALEGRYRIERQLGEGGMGLLVIEPPDTFAAEGRDVVIISFTDQLSRLGPAQ